MTQRVRLDDLSGEIEEKTDYLEQVLKKLSKRLDQIQTDVETIKRELNIRLPVKKRKRNSINPEAPSVELSLNDKS